MILLPVILFLVTLLGASLLELNRKNDRLVGKIELTREKEELEFVNKILLDNIQRQKANYAKYLLTTKRR